MHTTRRQISPGTQSRNQLRRGEGCMAKRPGGVMVQGTEATRSQLIPVMTKWHELGKTAQLGPVLFCIVAFFGMVTFGSTTTIVYGIVAADGKHYIDPRYWIYTSNFLIMLAV